MGSGSDPLRRSVEAVSSRTGLTTDAVAILFVVAGIIVLVWEQAIRFVLGIVLIVTGVLWLIQAWQARQPPRNA
jgi:uncharacterized membrane protein HdeD (DUF308 family)